MGKNNYLRFAATLAIICLAASGLLSLVFNLTQQKILDQALRQEEESLTEVFPAANDFQPVKEGDNVLYYKALDAQKNILGYAFKAAKKGYSSEIVTMVGMDTGGVISRIKILAQNETPGLGTKTTEVIQKNTLWDIMLRKAGIASMPRPWFQEQFSGKRADALYGNVNTITGATISSRAVIDSIQQKAKEIMGEINRGR